MKRTRQTKTREEALRTPIHEEVQEVEDLLRRPTKLGDYEGDDGDESKEKGEGVEDPILPHAGVVHLIPPIGGAPERENGRRGGHNAAPRRRLIRYRKEETKEEKANPIWAVDPTVMESTAHRTASYRVSMARLGRGTR
ncbi:hypothetical protein BHE74_00031717, partial [Ensete ventricosum]